MHVHTITPFGCQVFFCKDAGLKNLPPLRPSVSCSGPYPLFIVSKRPPFPTLSPFYVHNNDYAMIRSGNRWNPPALRPPTISDFCTDGVSQGDRSPVCGTPHSLFCVAGWGRCRKSIVWPKGHLRQGGIDPLNPCTVTHTAHRP